jgi:hypothetical protein
MKRDFDVFDVEGAASSQATAVCLALVEKLTDPCASSGNGRVLGIFVGLS